MGGNAQHVPAKLIAVLCLVSAACAIPAMAALSLEVSKNRNVIPADHSATLIGSGQFPSSFVLSDQPGGGKITWTVDGQVIAELFDARVWTTAGYTTTIEHFQNLHFAVYLKIEAMDATKNGEYRFQLKSGEIVQSTSPSLELAVEYQPSSEYPQCSVHSVGVDKRLVCKSERGSPLVSLQWMKGEDLLQQTTDDDGESFVEVYTTVGRGAISMGRYGCSMTYKGSRAGSCFLDRPNVWIPISTSGLAIGEDLEVICLASPSDNPPVSTFRWVVNPNRHHTLGNNGAVLHISNITSRDNGTEIICEGQNAMGRSRARSALILRPVETTPLPITFQMEQTETPKVDGGLARFECRTTPDRKLMWLFQGQYVDPLNLVDRFFVEGNLNNALSISGVTREDNLALVTCFVVDSFQKKYVMSLHVNFSLTTSTPLTFPTETPKHKSSSTTDIAEYGLFTVPAVSQTPNRRPISVTPKVDTSRSKEGSSFSNGQIMWYAIGGMMCIVLVGICCWVSLKAKALMCDPQRDTKSVAGPTSPTPSCQRNGENFVVRVGMPGEVRPSPTADQSLLTKEQLVEQEGQYQDLEDVSRQRQTNTYQRIINNDWIPPTQV